jgi:hypothetical protein
MEKSIPLQGAGEQSTKFGGPCPYCPQPPDAWRFESAFPPVELLLGCGLLGAGLLGVGLAGGGLLGGGVVGAGALAAVWLATAICNDFSFEFPFTSDTETAKLKFPEALGVPDMTPDARSRFTPWGICPQTTAKL